MMSALDASQRQRFQALVTAYLGWQFDEGQRWRLDDVLQRRPRASGEDVETYLSRLERNPFGEIGSLARALTIPETCFFRHVEQYRALTEHVIPERLAAQAAEKRLRILSLGCASGEEAYSLAMCVRDVLPDTRWDVSILGIDVNPDVIERARAGRYSAWALRNTPAEDRRRWFRAQGREFVLDEAVRASVRFEQRNLMDEDALFWQPGTYDVVFCRNVLMYFAPEQARRVIGRIARSLCRGGYLFLGHAETLRGLSDDFHVRHGHGAFYYQRRASAEPLALRSWPPAASPVAAFGAPETRHLDAGNWVDAIGRAAARVAALTDISEAEASSRAVPAETSCDLRPILDLLRTDRVAEALVLLDVLQPRVSMDEEVLLLRAVLLTYGGRLDTAEDACRRLLKIDACNAGAHHLLALCRNGAHDVAGARHYHQRAAYLDPSFALPRLHLGLLASRAAEPAIARRMLGQALALLERESASRVLLFGGGFDRHTLMTFCRAELVRCGGTP